MSEYNALIGQLLNGPVASKNEPNSIDIEFIASQLDGLVKWIRAKQGDVKSEFGPNSNQIWKGNFEPRDFSDPMGDWIGSIGQAQV